MFNWVLQKLFGSQNDRELKRIWPIVDRVNELEASTKKFSDTELAARTQVFKERLDNGESLDSILPEAFAAMREMSIRVLGMRPFDVQILGGVVLHEGTIAEMKTGEGKTLCATLPVYLNALSGKGVHVVTVNDYLASRDAEWMGTLYRAMGLSVGVIVENLSRDDRHRAYRSDITYGQNNQFGFDYLRDNMKMDLGEMVQRGHNYAIVDEVDSILVDESRTPLIISGPSDNPTETYGVADKVVRRLMDENDKLKRNIDQDLGPGWEISDPEAAQAELFYTIDLKGRNASLTEKGVRRVEEVMGLGNLFDPGNIDVLHHINQALKAHVVFKRDVDYLVRDNQVVIVDEFTGRQMEGRRWSDGLHQAVEAKEKVTIARESETLGTITFQNYFRMYNKLAGMTGTADTEAVEFKKIYNLDVIVVPTNMPMVRKDNPDVVYATHAGKTKAVCDELQDCQDRGQPVLVGTASIEASEHLSKHLKRRGIKHEVLNAKNHEREADIVAQAGRRGAVTISTNMAGRGTDIVLGGNPEFMVAHDLGTVNPEDPDFNADRYQELLEHYKVRCETEKQEVLDAGGLHVLGTERHESRRIDNQLRGRSGRQGDPGSSRFYVSLEDDLMKRFGGERMQALMTRVGMSEDDALEGRLVARAIENAQKKVEGFHFDIRKHLLEYDDVLNKQREVVYGLRKEILEGEDIQRHIQEMIPDVIEDIVLLRASDKDPVSEWDVEGMFSEVNRQFGLSLSSAAHVAQQKDGAGKGIAQDLFEYFKIEALGALAEREERFGKEIMQKLARFLYMQGIDFFWKEHLTNMDNLREGISLRAYGQKNPLHEYQRESFELFTAMMMTVKSEVLLRLCTSDLLTDEEIAEREEAEKEKQRKREEAAKTIHEDGGVAGSKKGDAQGINRRQRRRAQAMEKSGPAPEQTEVYPQPATKKKDVRKKAKAQRKARRKNR